MKALEMILMELNVMLKANDFSLDEFAYLISLLKALPNFEFILFDFFSYNEKLLKEVKQAKVSNNKSSNYQMATRMRDIERNCQKHINFKNGRNIDKSTFIFENNQLIYLHFGDAKNDNLVLPFFKSIVNK